MNPSRVQSSGILPAKDVVSGVGAGDWGVMSLTFTMGVFATFELVTLGFATV